MRANANRLTPCSSAPVTASAASGPAAGQQIATRRGPGGGGIQLRRIQRERAPARRREPLRRGRPFSSRRLSVGVRPLSPRAGQHGRQHADHRDDEDEDQREELPAPPVADGEVEQARRQRRDPDDHGHEQPSRRPARTAPRPACRRRPAPAARSRPAGASSPPRDRRTPRPTARRRTCAAKSAAGAAAPGSRDRRPAAAAGRRC